MNHSAKYYSVKFCFYTIFISSLVAIHTPSLAMIESTISQDLANQIDGTIPGETGQSFIPTIDGYIDKVYIASNTTGSSTFKLYSGDVASGMSSIYSQSVTLTDTVNNTGGVVNSYTYLEITLDTPQQVTSGQTYTFTLASQTAIALACNTSSDAYTDGHLIWYEGGLGWWENINRDLAFRVHLYALEAPTVTTTAASNETSGTAASGGEVTDEGDASVTARGVCWSTNSNPTTADSKTTDGLGSGVFSSSITGLDSGTTYHVRAYATNSVDTAYGNDETFATDPALQASVIGSGTVTSTPAGISCGADCEEGYTLSASISLTATPDAGSFFQSWSGACSGGVSTCALTMDSNKSVTATFISDHANSVPALDNFGVVLMALLLLFFLMRGRRRGA